MFENFLKVALALVVVVMLTWVICGELIIPGLIVAAVIFVLHHFYRALT